MRVIAGKYKRRLLKTLPGTDTTRPTSDRVKESLFNMLAPEINGAIVWDLFAGSGALGIESLSRGANHVTFVEKSRDARRIILENLKILNIPSDKFTVVEMGVEDFLRPTHRISGPQTAISAPHVTIVLADPPYESAWYNEALMDLSQTQRCAADCLVVLEMKAGRQIPEPDPGTWRLEDERTYGIAQLQFWRSQMTGG